MLAFFMVFILIIIAMYDWYLALLRLHLASNIINFN